MVFIQKPVPELRRFPKSSGEKILCSFNITSQVYTRPPYTRAHTQAISNFLHSQPPRTYIHIWKIVHFTKDNKTAKLRLPNPNMKSSGVPKMDLCMAKSSLKRSPRPGCSKIVNQNLGRGSADGSPPNAVRYFFHHTNSFAAPRLRTHTPKRSYFFYSNLDEDDKTVKLH